MPIPNPPESLELASYLGNNAILQSYFADDYFAHSLLILLIAILLISLIAIILLILLVAILLIMHLADFTDCYFADFADCYFADFACCFCLFADCYFADSKDCYFADFVDCYFAHFDGYSFIDCYFADFTDCYFADMGGACLVGACIGCKGGAHINVPTLVGCSASGLLYFSPLVTLTMNTIPSWPSQ